jgi:hypothetical protein
MRGCGLEPESVSRYDGEATVAGRQISVYDMYRYHRHKKLEHGICTS